MTMKSADIDNMCRRIRSVDVAVREHAADETTDVWRYLKNSEIAAISAALFESCLVEKVDACLEAQLNAIGEFVARLPLENWQVAQLSSLRSRELSVGVRTQLEALLE
jgi:hypothetical protein